MNLKKFYKAHINLIFVFCILTIVSILLNLYFICYDIKYIDPLYNYRIRNFSIIKSKVLENRTSYTFYDIPYSEYLIERLKLIRNNKNEKVEIALNHYPFDDRFIEIIHELKTIRQLNGLCIIAPVSLEELNAIQQLTQIDELAILADMDINMLYATIFKMKNLSYVKISSNEQLTYEEIMEIFLHYANLKMITVNGNNYTNPKSI